MTRPTYDSPMVEWLATVHDTVERMAAAASETGGGYDDWEWVFEETGDAVDIDGSTGPDGLVTSPDGLIYLSPADGDWPIFMGIPEIDASVARWMETFDPAAIMARVETERSIVELWHRAYRDGTELPYVAAMDSVVMRLAAGWGHMPGYQAGWRPGAMVGA
jgi:Family of unknown function (DUF6221)